MLVLVLVLYVLSCFAIIVTRERERERECWLLCCYCTLDDVLQLIPCSSSSRCRGLICSLRVWYFLITLTLFMWPLFELIFCLSANNIEINVLPKYVQFNEIKLSGALE